MKLHIGIKKNAKAAFNLEALISLYEVRNRAECMSLKTISWYTSNLKAFIRYLESEQSPCDLSVFNLDSVRNYILYLRNRPKFQGHPYIPEKAISLSPRSLQCHVRTLKAFSSWLCEESYTDENRLQNLKLPKAPVTVMEPLTPEEIEKITANINKKSPSGARNHAIITTLLDTGIRVSEIIGITLGNLNLSDGYFKVMGKGSKERIVPIGKYVRRILWDYIDKARPQAASSDVSTLFLTADGKSLTVNTMKLLFARLAKGSGVTRLHAHLCRHTFAINYLINGGDIFSLKEILGHTTLEMVNHYLHFTSSQITAQHHKFSPMDKLHGETL